MTVGIAWYLGDQRQAYFRIDTSLDGATWTTVWTNGISSGGSNEVELFNLEPVMARYVRIVGNGNSANLWNSITEVQMFGFTPQSDPLEGLPLVAVAASGNDGNLASNTLDSDWGTRWSANGSGQWIRYDLGCIQPVRYVGAAWYLGDQRQSYFDIEVSVDGVQWISALVDGVSTGTTLDMELYEISPVDARYVRITGNGNEVNLWNSITEARAYAALTP